MSAVDRLDGFQRRHRWAALPLAVVYKFHDDQGIYLAALITYFGFLSLFPLLLLLTSILGFVLQNNPELHQRMLDSTLSQFPVIGDQLGDPEGLRGSGIALVVSALVAVYGTLGVAHAMQNAMNVAWAVPRCRRPNPLHLRLRSLVLIAIGGLATLVTTVLSALVGSAGAFGTDLGWLSALLVVVASVAVNAAVFVVGFWICVSGRGRCAASCPVPSRRPSSGNSCSWSGRRTWVASSRAPTSPMARSPWCSGFWPGSSSRHSLSCSAPRSMSCGSSVSTRARCSRRSPTTSNSRWPTAAPTPRSLRPSKPRASRP